MSNGSTNLSFMVLLICLIKAQLISNPAVLHYKILPFSDTCSGFVLIYDYNAYAK